MITGMAFGLGFTLGVIAAWITASRISDSQEAAINQKIKDAFECAKASTQEAIAKLESKLSGSKPGDMVDK
jgi:hypothetical protein